MLLNFIKFWALVLRLLLVLPNARNAISEVANLINIYILFASTFLSFSKLPNTTTICNTLMYQASWQLLVYYLGAKLIKIYTNKTRSNQGLGSAFEIHVIGEINSRAIKILKDCKTWQPFCQPKVLKSGYYIILFSTVLCAIFAKDTKFTEQLDYEPEFSTSR